MSLKNFPELLAERLSTVEQALAGCLPPESADPPTIHRAMRYSLLVGGKRMRPILCLGAAEVAGGDLDTALLAACAVECIHTYSLIHDDLPCMDNDDFRRGRPTSHKVFGEGMAVLAGDALLTEAFALAARIPCNERFSTADYVRELAAAAGSKNLIAGQVADIEAEGNSGAVSADELRAIHERKTGALIRCSLRLGAMSAGASDEVLDALERFGGNLGLAFQVIDDILDVTQTSERLGKSAGKDEASGKATYPALLGLDGARSEAARLTEAAGEALASFGERGHFLAGIADLLLNREN